MSSNTQKLRVLRSRTDEDLLVLVNRELERGLTAVQLATAKSSPLYAHAGRALDTATALFQRISGLSADDRLRVEASIRGLRSGMDQVPAYANLRAYQSSVAS